MKTNWQTVNDENCDVGKWKRVLIHSKSCERLLFTKEQY